MSPRAARSATLAVSAVVWASCAHSPAVAPGAGETHLVQEGETPYAISRRYGVTVEALLAANGLDDPRKLRAGQRLVVPAIRGASPVLERGPAPAPELPPPVEPPTAAEVEAPPPAVKSPEPDPEALDPAALLPTPPDPDLESMRATFRSSPRAKSAPLIWPVDGVIVSLFGHREGQRHDGIDLGAPIGSAVWAAADGEVIFAGEQPGYGRLVILQHTDGLVTIYAHNAANLVKQGVRVSQGEPIAQVGHSGGQASPALHFEVRVDRAPINPLSRLPDE